MKKRGYVMNIIYLHTQDLGRCCSPYGYPVKTPNMQRFAEDGVVFKNAFCTAPTCSPSRASLLTGQYPHELGMLGLTGQGWRINQPEHHLALFLKKHGYITGLAGLQHEFEVPPEVAPYDVDSWATVGKEQNGRHLDTDEAIKFIRENTDNKFFLSVGLYENHHHVWQDTCDKMSEFYGEPDYRYVRPLPPFPDNPRTRIDAAQFYRSIEYFDMQIGRIMTAVRESGVEDDTLILITTDHGIGMPQIKMNLTDAGLGVAFMFRGPGIPKGKIVENMVSQLDFVPFLCDYIGIETPEWAVGKSLMPLIKGEDEALHDNLFFEQCHHADFVVPMRAVRTERYKYIKSYFESRSYADVCSDLGETYFMLVDAGLGKKKFPEEALYDLYFDPNEACNLINDPDYAEIAETMRGALSEWQSEVNDIDCYEAAKTDGRNNQNI